MSATDSEGRSCLHMAAHAGSIEVITSLFSLILTGIPQVTDFLVSSGAELVLQDSLGRLALHYAAARCTSEQVTSVQNI